MEKAEQYVKEYYAAHDIDGIYFYNFEHTASVVKAAELIAEQSNLGKKGTHILKIAAWFQYTGYLQPLQQPVQASTELAMNFLICEKADNDLLLSVTDLISATGVENYPSGQLQEILYDASFSYMAKKSFSDKNRALKLEKEFREHSEITKQEWLKQTIVMFENHKYYTAYGHAKLTNKKKQKLEKLKKVLWMQELDAAEKGLQFIETKDVPPADEEATEKGIDTMFRVVSSYNQKLISVADNKAHIMITANSIIMSAIISLVLRRLPSNSYLTWPTFILLGTSFFCTIFSILATRPQVPAGKFTKRDMDSREIDLLYFGNYYKMAVDEYMDGLHQVMASQTFLYDMLARNVYSQGIILGKKYEFLRTAYSVFLFGLIISILTYIIAYFSQPDLEVLKSLIRPK